MRIERILIGMDFSAPAVAGARWAADHLAPAAELILAHVIDLPAPPAFARGAAPSHEAIETAAREHAEARLHELASFLASGAARTEIRVGRAHEALAALAEETAADLVLIGPHGDRPRPWKLLGSTAERLVRTSPVPVLVATGTGSATPRRLLVPVDESDLAPHVLAWARDLAETFDADVTVLTVLSNAVYSHIASMAAVTTRDEAAAREQVDAEMRSVATRWLESLVGGGRARERASAKVTHGKAGDEILAVAEELGADLIVMGRRGTGPVRPALLGSTVSTVLHGARCPVLVVTEPQDTLVEEE